MTRKRVSKRSATLVTSLILAGFKYCNCISEENVYPSFSTKTMFMYISIHKHRAQYKVITVSEHDTKNKVRKITKNTLNDLLKLL